MFCALKRYCNHSVLWRRILIHALGDILRSLILDSVYGMMFSDLNCDRALFLMLFVSDYCGLVAIHEIVMPYDGWCLFCSTVWFLQFSPSHLGGKRERFGNPAVFWGFRDAHSTN